MVMKKAIFKKKKKSFANCIFSSIGIHILQSLPRCFFFSFPPKKKASSFYPGQSLKYLSEDLCASENSIITQKLNPVIIKIARFYLTLYLHATTVIARAYQSIPFYLVMFGLLAVQ